MKASLNKRQHIGRRDLRGVLLMVMVLASGPVLAEGRGQLERIDGVEIAALSGDTPPAILVDFGSVQVGFARLVGLLYRNVGAGPITDIALGQIEGANPEVFAITEDNCTGATLAPAAGCVIVVRFEPPAMSSYSAEFSVTSTAANSPERVDLLGAGIVDALFRDRFQ